MNISFLKSKFENIFCSNLKVLLFLAFVTFILNFYFLFGSSIWNLDLFFYIEGGRSISDNAVLYKDFGEIKPPLVFFLFSFFIKLFSYEAILGVIKVAAFLVKTLSAFLIFLSAKKVSENSNALIIAVIFAGALQIHYYLWDFNVMIIMLLPLSLQIYLLLTFNGSRFLTLGFFLSGLCMALCALLSTNMVLYFFIYPVYAFYLSRKFIKTAMMSLLALSGFLVPMGLLFLYFYSHNALSDWYWWNFEWAGMYGGAYSIPLRIWKFFWGMLRHWEWLPLFIMGFAGLYYFLKERAYKKSSDWMLIFLFMLSAFVSRLPFGKGEYRFNLYLLPLLLFSLLYLLQKKDWLKKYAGKIVLGVIGVLLAAGFTVNHIGASAKKIDSRVEKRSEVYKWIKNNSQPTDKIYVWNEGHEIYFYSGRKMATSYFSAGQHLDYPYIWENNGYKKIDKPWGKFLSELEREKPAIIADHTDNFNTGLEKERKEQLKNYMELFTGFVARNYEFKTEIAGIKLWKLKKSD